MAGTTIIPLTIITADTALTFLVAGAIDIGTFTFTTGTITMRGASLTIIIFAVAAAIAGVAAVAIDGVVLAGGQISTAAIVVVLTITAGGGFTLCGGASRIYTFTISTDAIAIVVTAVLIVDEQAVTAGSPAAIASIAAGAI